MRLILNKIFSGIYEISRGMFTVFKHIFRKPITLEYPEKKPNLPASFRGRVSLLVNEDGSDKCIACGSCARVCPCVDLIQIEKAKNEEGKFYPKEFTIDVGRCIFCGNCESVCPTNAIVLSKEFELADYSRESLVCGKNELTLSIEKSKAILEEKGKES